jgi:uncharacterized protein
MQNARRAAVLAALIVTSPAAAASFDCGKARTPDELAVCATPALSARDSEMGGLWFAYSRIPMMMGSNGARHEEALRFLAQRAACGRDIGCLTRAYDARIAVLRDGIDVAMTELLHLENPQ